MNAGRLSITKVFGAATIVMVPLVAAAWLPQGFPHLLRQILLCLWGVGAILAAERLLFSDAMSTALHSLGFVPTRRVAVFVAILTSLPMWGFLPLFASSRGAAVHLRADWVAIVAGVVLVNGITEEVIHRGFVFGHLRRYRSFATAATLSALLFTVQHLYIVVTNGWTIGGAAVVLAALISYPMAFAFERGGNSIVPPAILHASANAPVLVFQLPDDLMATALVSHMGVIVVALFVMPLPFRGVTASTEGADPTC